MMRPGVKIGIIIGIVVLILVGIAIPVYYNFVNKTVYHVTDVDKTTYTAAEFTDKSELQFFKNGTFHIHIEHKDNGLSFTGIGTYTKDGNTYQLTFVQAYARDNDDNIVDYTDHGNEVSCERSGSRIKFIDHKGQTFYFG